MQNWFLLYVDKGSGAFFCALQLDKILMIDKDLEPVSVHYKLDKILMNEKLNSETNQRIYTQQTINAFQVKENFFFDMQDFLPFFRGSKFGSNNHDIVLVEGVRTCLLRGAAVTNKNVMNLTHTTSKYSPTSSEKTQDLLHNQHRKKLQL
jgi:hypothetical protein